jgi:RNA polymerase sigma factor (sigma-70 family)
MGLVVSAAVAERDDPALVADVRSGDDRAFEELYMRYRRRIAAYVQGMVGDHARAEDITQEVFISALRRMRETERPITFKPWVYEIAKNACIDSYRRSRRAEEVSLDAEVLAPADYGRLAGAGPSPETAVEGKQKLGDLCSAFGGLSETHHEILVLRELEGLSYREIGERMGLSRPSVESTLFRARRRLTEEYDDLASGRRCQRIQSMIEGAAEARLGIRDRRRMARHLSCCQSCRRHARLAGIDDVDVRQGLAARIAAFLPLPFLLRRVRGGGEAATSAGGHTGTSVAQIAAGLAPSADQVAGWSKAALVAASVAVAGAGAGVATQATSSSISHGSAKPATAAPLTPAVRHRGSPASSPSSSSSPSSLSAPARLHGKTGRLRSATPRHEPAVKAPPASTGAGTTNGATNSSSSSSSPPSSENDESSTNQPQVPGTGSHSVISVTPDPLQVHVDLPPQAQPLQAPVDNATSGLSKTVDGATKTVDGATKTVDGATKTVDGATKTVDGATTTVSDVVGGLGGG